MFFSRNTIRIRKNAKEKKKEKKINSWTRLRNERKLLA